MRAAAARRAIELGAWPRARRSASQPRARPRVASPGDRPRKRGEVGEVAPVGVDRPRRPAGREQREERSDGRRQARGWARS